MERSKFLPYIVKNCPSCTDYDVFGVDNTGCCYKYHKYCKEVDNCSIKQHINRLRQYLCISGTQPDMNITMDLHSKFCLAKDLLNDFDIEVLE